MLRIAMWVGALLLASTASADIVRLKSGGKVEGIVTMEGDTLVVEVAFGIVRVAKSDVLGIEKSRTFLEEYRARAAALKPDDVAGHLDLARWCEDHDQNSLAEREFLKILDTDPDHEMARRSLGYERYEGKWLTHDEVMEAKGFVRYEGKWVTAEERSAREALRLKEEERRREEAEARQKAEAERRDREAEAEAARSAAEDARARAQAQYLYTYTRTQSPYYYGYGGGYWPYYYYNHIDYARTFNDSATGAKVVVVRHPNGSEQWYLGNPSNGNLIHTSGDGHCTQETSAGGVTTKQHFANPG